MIGIASRNLQMVHPLKAGLVRNFSTKGIDLKATRFEDIKHIVSGSEDFVVRQVRPLKRNASDKSEKDKVLRKLDKHFISVFSKPIIQPSQETTIWLDTQFQGFSFSDLVEKNMISKGSLGDSLKRISKTASTPNSEVTEKMAAEPVTKVTSRYKSDMVQHTLFRPAFTASRLLKYELVALQKEK